MRISLALVGPLLTALSLATAQEVEDVDIVDSVDESDLFTAASFGQADATDSDAVSAKAANQAGVHGNCLGRFAGIAACAFSPGTVIACQGTPQQQASTHSYWGEQEERNTQIVVVPATANDLALVVRAISYAPSLDWSFVSGGHSQVNASSADDVLIDLSYLNKTQLLPNFKLPDGKRANVVSYESGAKWQQVYGTLANTGFTAIGARMSFVGVGGFTTGGGIGFLAGALGFAMDRVVQMEVVLASGELVVAAKTGKYSDLFWAIQGGNGQFGIVTKFYVLAATEPTLASFQITAIQPGDLDKAMSNTAEWYKTNKDPYSVCYFFRSWSPLFGSNDTSKFVLQSLWVTVQFSTPDSPNPPSFDSVFAPLLKGVDTTASRKIALPYYLASTIFDGFFLPDGLRRGFYGPQVSSLSLDFLKKATNTFDAYIQNLVMRGEPNIQALWGMQYMFPGLNGNAPKSASDTAWPHNVVGHQSLFSPGYTLAKNDGLMQSYTSAFNTLCYDRQAQTGLSKIPDYPNYLSPRTSAGMSKTFRGIVGWDGSRVWGNNLGRLQSVKQKYDPDCLIRTKKGPVFASTGCLAKGYASIF